YLQRRRAAARAGNAPFHGEGGRANRPGRRGAPPHPHPPQLSPRHGPLTAAGPGAGRVRRPGGGRPRWDDCRHPPAGVKRGGRRQALDGTPPAALSRQHAAKPWALGFAPWRPAFKPGLNFLPGRGVQGGWPSGAPPARPGLAEVQTMQQSLGARPLWVLASLFTFFGCSGATAPTATQNAGTSTTANGVFFNDTATT